MVGVVSRDFGMMNRIASGPMGMVRTRLRRLVDSALTSGQLENLRTELVNSGSSSCPFYTNPDMTQFRRRIPSAPLGLARAVLPHTPSSVYHNASQAPTHSRVSSGLAYIQSGKSNT